jgi:hypothetical protein
MFTIATVIVFTLLLLLLLCYCHHYKTVATDNPLRLRASLFPGAAELTTHLLRLINILWLPLCRINKCGFYFLRRLLRSPILVGHQPPPLTRDLTRKPMRTSLSMTLMMRGLWRKWRNGHSASWLRIRSATTGWGTLTRNNWANVARWWRGARRPSSSPTASFPTVSEARLWWCHCAHRPRWGI